MAKRKTRAEKEAMRGYNYELGVTDGQFRTYIITSLRETFRNTRRAAFIRKVRIPYKGPRNWSYYVQCVECERQMGDREKFRPRTTTGKLAKRETSTYDVDHRHGITPYKNLEDLTAFAKDLFQGELQVLCYRCHKDKTKQQKAKKGN